MRLEGEELLVWAPPRAVAVAILLSVALRPPSGWTSPYGHIDAPCGAQGSQTNRRYWSSGYARLTTRLETADSLVTSQFQQRGGGKLVPGQTRRTLARVLSSKNAQTSISGLELPPDTELCIEILEATRRVATLKTGGRTVKRKDNALVDSEKRKVSNYGVILCFYLI